MVNLEHEVMPEARADFTSTLVMASAMTIAGNSPSCALHLRDRYGNNQEFTNSTIALFWAKADGKASIVQVRYAQALSAIIQSIHSAVCLKP